MISRFEPGIFVSQRENMCFFCSMHFKQIYVPKQARLIPRLMWSCDVLTFPTLSLRNTCSVGRHRWRRLFFLVFMLLGRSGTQPGRWNGWSHFKRPCIWSTPRIRKDENTRSNSNSREMEVNTTRNRMVQMGIYTWHKYSCLVLICLILGSVKTYSIDIDIVLCFSPLFSIDSLLQWSFFVSGVFCRYRRFLSRSCCQCRRWFFFIRRSTYKAKH